MKIRFRGWKREVLTHHRDVYPVTRNGDKYRVGEKGAPLQWESDAVTLGRVNRLGLSGDFLIEMEFNKKELRSWLQHYVKENPEQALRLLASMQAEAIIALHAAKEPA